MVPLRKSAKTYAHLAHQKRMPSEYELLSSQLLYYPNRGFELKVPIADFYAQHQLAGPIICEDWERFDDPRKTTYTRYVELQAKQECYVDGLLESMEAPAYAERLSAEWLDRLRYFAALRFPLHGLQMLAAHVGQLAPSGKITIAAAFQAADEMRRVQRIAYRMAQLRETRPTFGDDARALWEDDPAFQPLRRLIEMLLVTFGFCETLIALNVCTKPLFDAIVHVELAEVARRESDPMFGAMLEALHADARWHAAWGAELVRVLIEPSPANRSVLAGFARTWTPRAVEAVRALIPALLGVPTTETDRLIDDHHARTIARFGSNA